MNDDEIEGRRISLLPNLHSNRANLWGFPLGTLIRLELISGSNLIEIEDVYWLHSCVIEGWPKHTDKSYLKFRIVLPQ